jgi:DNA invertase Pin-like site-specific DNA recombinase
MQFVLTPLKRKPPKAYSYLRFSTADQIRGDSLRRQTSLAKEWCQRHKFELVEDYRDLGISAFHGANADRGALRAFLQKVETGEIEKGSYLIVESLDRLSRTAITEALQMFLGIINSGVVVVTLADDKTYDRDRINDGNFTDLIISLTILSRANEESRTKSKRLSAAWSNKRDNIREKKLTAKCVSWLELQEDRKKFRLIPERVKIVQEIFAMTAAGKGAGSIARELNRRKVPTFGRSKGWHISFIKKTIENRAVIGEFRPTAKRDGKSVPLDPVPDYYPAIISKVLFGNVHRVRRVRPSYRGRGQFNVFSKVAFDKDTGAPMVYVNKGRSKGFHYLCCALAPRGLAPYRTWNYDDFLTKFLFVCRKASERKMRPMRSKSTELDLAKAELDEVEGKAANLVKVLSRGYIESVENELRTLEAKRTDLMAKVRTLESLKSATRIDMELIKWEDLSRLRENIRATVKCITVDAASKWFKTEMLDGASYTFWIKDGIAHFVSGVESKLKLPEASIGKVRQEERTEKKKRVSRTARP